MREPYRLGVYVDDVFRVVEGPEGCRVSSDRAFLLFACEVGSRFQSLVLFGRTVMAPAHADYVLPAAVRLVRLPHYANLRRIREVARATLGTVKGFWRGLEQVDIVWVFGPHPFAFLMATLASARGKHVVFGVRQDTRAYFRARLPSARWAPVLLCVDAMDGFTRLLSRRVKTTIVGRGLAHRYGNTKRLLPMTVSLVRAADVRASLPGDPSTGSRVRLLTVGRLEPEKNPLLLVEAMARLERQRPGCFELTWVGRGVLARAVAERAVVLQVNHRIEWRDYIPFGPDLLGLYRESDIFVHVSLTEGVPQVLVEAWASGTPIVATDVGGVREALHGGDAGLLVPAKDVDALVQSITRVANDVELRRRLVVRGLELARQTTLDVEAERVARFIADGFSARSDGYRRCSRL